MKKITIVSPTYNEEKSVELFLKELYKEINKINKKYKIDILIIDNNSEDKTQTALESYAKKNKDLKLIFNQKNYGAIISPYHAILNTSSDSHAIIYMASDLQDPPHLIHKFIKEWELGSKVVMAVKKSSDTNLIINLFRKSFYRILNKFSSSNLVNDSTGFGLYDKQVIDLIKKINDPCPYFRGLVADLGFIVKKISFHQPKRLNDKSKGNIYHMYENAILAFVNHTIIPIRLASFLGFILGFISIIIGILFLIFKLIYWNSFSFGIAPLLILVSLVGGITLIFIGILGEYVARLINLVDRKPSVIEKKRINF